MELTTHSASNTRASSPARRAEIAAASPHGPAPTIATSITLLSPYSRFPIPDSPLFESDDLIPPRPHTDVHDRRGNKLANAIQISASFGRQRLQRSRVARGLLPPLEPLVDRLDVQCGDVARKFPIDVIADLVARTYRDPIERVEHIELRHRQTAQPIHARRITNDHGVEPAAAPRSAGHGAELVAELAYKFTELTGNL